MLTDTKIRALKPKDKIQSIRDDRGLFFVITPQGGCGWRFRYRHSGKEKMVSLGTYPEVGLATAREKRDELRKIVAQGLDPSVQRQEQKIALVNTLNVVFEDWYKKRAQEWNEAHAIRNRRRYEIHVKPILGERPITEITAPVVLECLERIQIAGTLETAHRVKGILSGVFDYATAKGLIQLNPTSSLSKALVAPPKKHYPAPLTGSAVNKLLAQIWDYQGSLIVQSAIKIGCYLFVRPGELRHMKWAEIEENIWRRKISKINTELVTPLPLQVINLLKILKILSGNGVYVFPNSRAPKADRPMSEVAVIAAFRRSGITGEELVGHSWRATARTICDEVLGFRPDVIEHAMGHQVKDALGRAYNRTTYLNERTRLAQAWADWVDEQRNSRY